MTVPLLAHSPRRRRRKLFIIGVASFCFLLFLAHQYLAITINILFRGPYIAAYHSDHLRISQDRDGFDVTFDSYSSQPSFSIDQTAPVPAIMHHIMLGLSANNIIGLSTARQACVDMHPGYEFKMWSDANSAQFVKTYFPELYSMWSSYPHTIQKADSLRYMILYVYGGKTVPVCHHFRALQPILDCQAQKAQHFRS
jgi:mannosyltransferase OCH1-like enzyme